MEWPDGPRLFEHLRDLPAPLRVAEVPGYLGSLGLSVSPWGSRTLQGTPMHHRGEHLGNFFLGDREDGETFTAEDEEILVLFASQAATAIANARTHRDVERARADLEALVETSPVGIVVFDSGTGRAVSEDGTLVPVFERPRVEASERCCLITTAASRQRPEVQTFREWILNEGGGRGPHGTRPRPAPAVTRLRLPFSPPAPRALSRNTGGFLSRTRAGGNADRADEAWMSLADFRGLPSKEDSSPRSVPVPLGVPPQRVGEFGVALAAPDGALYEIDAPPQIGESGGAGDGVDGGQDGGQRPWQVQGSKSSLWPGPGRSGAGRRRCSPTGREIPTPPNSTTKSAARSSESSKTSAPRMSGCSKSMATCRPASSGSSS